MKIIKSTCGICYAGCGILIHVENGKPVKIEGDPESPVNKSLLCKKALASLKYLYHPEPIVYIHPDTAAELGIKEGDWVWLATTRGRIRQKAAFSEDIDPRVVGVDYAWWFPEKGADQLYGWRESNINILTDDNPPYNRESGSTNLRGILCKVYKE